MISISKDFLRTDEQSRVSARRQRRMESIEGDGAAAHAHACDASEISASMYPPAARRNLLLA